MLAITLALGMFLSSACTLASPSSSSRSEYDSAVAEGREVFANNCAACHGPGGEGQPDWHIRKVDDTLPAPPLNGDGHTWHLGEGLLYQTISQGGAMFEDPNYAGFKSGMPAFGDKLTHQEIVAVITYVKSLWGDKTKLGNSIRETQALVSEQDPFPEAGGGN